MTEVTERNTKKEILAELKGVKKALKDAQDTLRNEKSKYGEKPTTKKDMEVIKSADNVDINTFRDTRLEINDILTQSETKILESKEKLESIKKAISLKEKELKDLYDIEVEADTLESLIRANKIERDSHMRDFEDLKKKCHMDISELRNNFTKLESDLKEKFKRDEEELKFQINKLQRDETEKWKREKEETEYNFKKKLTEERDKFSKELDEFEKRSEDYNNLVSKVDLFPTTLEEKINEAISKTKKDLERSHHFAIEAVKRDSATTLAILEEQIKSLKTYNQDLKERLDNAQEEARSANNRLESIAKESIAGASKQKFTINTGDKDK